MKRQQVKVFDTSLRDGQQCPGAGMSLENNLCYAKLAKKVGVDILEAGFPSASKLDFRIVDLIAQMYASDADSPIVAALCQLREEQINITIESLTAAIEAKKARLHVYLPVDPNLMQASLGRYAENKQEMINDLARLIKQSVDAGLEVEYSPEGYSRMGNNFDFVTDTIRAAVASGATIINCPDTIGSSCKWQGENYFVEKIKAHATIIAKEFTEKTVTWSAHCHNDFGLALSNTMNAVFAGPVRQIEGCFNGIGERAGNVALEQCVMYIKAFGSSDLLEHEFFTNISTKSLQEISDFVSIHMLPRQPHWPISGENAAKHSCGGHTNAILRNPRVYQPFAPKDVGQQISFIFGPLSGGTHAKSIIEAHGYRCDENEKNQIGQFVKDFHVDRRKGITDSELMEAYYNFRYPILIDELNYNLSNGRSSIVLTGKFFDKKTPVEFQFQGKDSALYAVHEAICEFLPGLSIITLNFKTINYGATALSQTTIVVKFGSALYTVSGQDKDQKLSALKALIKAANKAYITNQFKIPSTSHQAYIAADYQLFNAENQVNSLNLVETFKAANKTFHAVLIDAYEPINQAYEEISFEINDAANQTYDNLHYDLIESENLAHESIHSQQARRKKLT